MIAFFKYIASAIFIWVALFLGFGKIPESEIKRAQYKMRELNYKPTKKKRKNPDQWGKRYFKNK